MSDDETITRMITPVPDSLLTRIEDYRFANRIPSRAETVRQLLEIALNTKEHRSAPT